MVFLRIESLMNEITRQKKNNIVKLHFPKKFKHDKGHLCGS